MRISFLLLALWVTALFAYEDTLVVQTFDNTTGYTASEFSDGSSDYFTRWADTLAMNHPFTGAHGDNYFVAEDTDEAENPLGAGSPAYLRLDGVDVLAYDSVKVIIALAATDGEIPSLGHWQGNTFEKDDSLLLQFAFDGDSALTGVQNIAGGNYSEISRFVGSEDFSMGMYSAYFAEDPEKNGLHDIEKWLTSAFQDFSYTIPVTGNVFSFRLRIDVDGLDDVGFDNIRIVGVGNHAPVITCPDTLYIPSVDEYTHYFSVSDADDDEVQFYFASELSGFKGSTKDTSITAGLFPLKSDIDSILVEAYDGKVITSKYIKFMHSDRMQDSVALCYINDVANKQFGWDYTTKLNTWDHITVSGAGVQDRVISLRTPTDIGQWEMTGIIGWLTGLTTLKINNAKNISGNIETLSTLKTLHIENSIFESYLLDYSRLSDLEELTIENSDLREFPQGVIDLAKLRALELTFNPNLEIIPENLFVKHMHLETLDLSNNALFWLDSTIGYCQKLKNIKLENNKLDSLRFSLTGLDLQSLNVAGNNLVRFPDSIWTQKSLENLYLQNNQITSVPDSLITMSTLRNCDLRSNKILYLPDSMKLANKPTFLHVSDNELEQVPVGLIGTGQDWSENLLQYDVLEAIYNAFPPVFEYLKSSKLFLKKDTVIATIGDITSLDRTLRGSRNEYQWYKDGNALGVPESTGVYSFTADLNSGGTYWAVVTQSWFPGVVLTTDTLFVQTNEKPVITSATTVTAEEDIRFVYKATATDSEQNVTYRFENLPSWLTSDVDSVYGTPLEGCSDTSFTLIATDGYSEVSAQVTVTVTAVNDAPVLTMVKAQTVAEDSPLTVTLAMTDAADVDNNLTDASIVLSAGANYTVAGQTITPAVNFNGDLIVPVTVTDGVLSSATVNMTVTVTPVNDAPVLTMVKAQTVAEDSPLTVTLAMTDAADVDNNLTDASIVLGAGANYTVAGQTITPAVNFNGDLIVPVTVTDGVLSSATVNMMVTVTPDNDAPVLTMVKAQTVAEDTPLMVTLAMTDAADVDNSLTDANIVLGAGANYVVVDQTLQPALNYVGDLTVPVTITDGVVNSATVNMTVTVTPVNDAPVLTAVTPQVTKQETPIVVTLAMTNATDVDNTLFDASVVLTAGANYHVEGTTVTPLDGFVGVLSVPVTITDGALNSETVAMTITVEPTVAIEEADEEASTVEAFAVAPNIITDEDAAHFVINEKLSGEGRIVVLDHLGDVIDEQLISIDEGGHFFWDLRNSSGVSVSSGIYLVVLELDGSYYQQRIGIKR